MKHWSPEMLHSHLQVRQICPTNCPAPNAQLEALGQEKLEVILDALSFTLPHPTANNICISSLKVLCLPPLLCIYVQVSPFLLLCVPFVFGFLTLNTVLGAEWVMAEVC